MDPFPDMYSLHMSGAGSESVMVSDRHSQTDLDDVSFGEPLKHSTPGKDNLSELLAEYNTVADGSESDLVSGIEELIMNEPVCDPEPLQQAGIPLPNLDNSVLSIPSARTLSPPVDNWRAYGSTFDDLGVAPLSVEG